MYFFLSPPFLLLLRHKPSLQFGLRLFSFFASFESKSVVFSQLGSVCALFQLWQFIPIKERENWPKKQKAKKKKRSDFFLGDNKMNTARLGEDQVWKLIIFRIKNGKFKYLYISSDQKSSDNIFIVLRNVEWRASKKKAIILNRNVNKKLFCTFIIIVSAYSFVSISFLYVFSQSLWHISKLTSSFFPFKLSLVREHAIHPSFFNKK